MRPSPTSAVIARRIASRDRFAHSPKSPYPKTHPTCLDANVVLDDCGDDDDGGELEIVLEIAPQI